MLQDPLGAPLQPLGAPADPTHLPIGGGGGVKPSVDPVMSTPQGPAGGLPVVTIPAVDAVEEVTASPFVRGTLVGLAVGAAVVGALWWFSK